VKHHEASATRKYSPEFYFYYHRNRLRYAAKWLGWPALWETFRPAEHARLHTAPLLDRRVARLAYQAGVPPLDLPSAEQRAATLATGRALRAGAQVTPVDASLVSADAPAGIRLCLGGISDRAELERALKVVRDTLQGEVAGRSVAFI